MSKKFTVLHVATAVTGIPVVKDGVLDFLLACTGQTKCDNFLTLKQEGRKVLLEKYPILENPGIAAAAQVYYDMFGKGTVLNDLPEDRAIINFMHLIDENVVVASKSQKLYFKREFEQMSQDLPTRQ